MTEICWQPSDAQIANSEMTQFMHAVNNTFTLNLEDYTELYQWSIDHADTFWSFLADYCQVNFVSKPTSIVENPDAMPGATWFPGATLNFAEHLLRYRDERSAIIFHNEAGHQRQLSYEQLFAQVAKLSHYLRELGIVAGDRVAGFVANTPETVVAMLAATSLGAVWTSTSPDFGINGVIDRFGQTQPKVLFAVDGHYYGNKTFDDTDKLQQICEQLPDLEKLVVIPYLNENPDLSRLPNATQWKECLNNDATDIDFVAVGFNDPLYIMYSSGTTGKPKCMAQGVGGVLLQHMKELKLHTNLTRDDVFFFFTTCGWMMWNWLVSGLSVGCSLVLYDGSPFHPNHTILIDLIDQCGITVFGIGAKYIEAISRHHISPIKSHQLDSLKTILSTGSPLLPESFDYIYANFPKDVRTSSISGGSDIVSCFALGNPNLPVYRGELQCRGLGLKVEVYNDDGQSVRKQKGELVCTASFPCMPIYFWNDPNGERYHSAYFEHFANTWAHGDYAELTKHDGIIIFGRSDATLNPSGVRVGTAEIYSQVDQFDEILDCIAVGQDWRDSERIVMFVIMRDGQTLDDDLKAQIKQAIKTNCSPHHVPAKIIAVADIPRTISGKAVEIAVKKTINGQTVNNLDALANPQALELYKNLDELQH